MGDAASRPRSARPHSLLISHVRLRDTHGWIGIRPGCLACEERFGPDYADHLNTAEEGRPMTLINLTPHPIRIYGGDTPDRIDPADYEPMRVIDPDPDLPPARIGTIELGTQYVSIGVPVEYVEYTPHGGLVHPLPERREGVWYIVALVVAMQQTYIYNRPDLLVPYLEVRNMDGTMIGCKMLARPV